MERKRERERIRYSILGGAMLIGRENVREVE